MRGLSAARAAARRIDEEENQKNVVSPKHKPTFYDKIKEARRRATKYLSLLPPPVDEEHWKKVGRCMKGIDPGAQSRELWMKWTDKFKDKKYCQMVWETFFREKKENTNGRGHRRTVSNASLSSSSASLTSGSFSVSDKMLFSIHKRICREDSTKLVSKQQAVKAKQANILNGRAAEDGGNLPGFQKLLRRTISNFFKKYTIPEAELAAVNKAKGCLNLCPVVMPSDGTPASGDEPPAYYVTLGLFQKLLEEKLGVAVSSQKQVAEMLALVRVLAGLPASQRLGSKRIRVGDAVEVQEVATGDWYRAEVQSINKDDTYAVHLKHKTTIPLEDRDDDEETPQAMALVNRKCIWRQRVVPPHIHHYVAVSLHSFLKFIARSDEAEQAKQRALARAQESLRQLKTIASDVVKAENEQRKLREGGVPRQPVLEAVRLGEDTAWEQMTTLRLHWQAAPFSDAVSFYMVETCGTDGARNVKSTQWRTVATDPPNANVPPTFTFLFEGLSPGASYTFRVRAFNQHGASPYTFRTFTTMPAPPPIPIVQKLAPTKLVLSWRLEKNEDVAQLKRLFAAIDADGNGRVSKQELLDCVEVNADAKLLLSSTYASRAAIKQVLSLSAQLSAGDNGEQISVFDCVSSLEVVDLSWKDFLKLFGRAERDQTGASVTGIPLSQLLGEERKDAADAVRLRNYQAKMKGSTQSKDLNYIVQRLHGPTQEWRDLCTSRNTNCTIVGVQPGDRWSYRVVSINRLNQRSVPSESIVVAQPLPKPPPPLCAPGRSVAENAVVLSLKADPATESKASQVVGTASGTTVSVEDILKRWQAGGSRADSAENRANASNSSNLWVNEGDEDGVGRTLDAIFSKFDTDGRGTIDAAELRFVLLELGAPAGPDEVSAAMQRLDQDDSGSISREEFAAWWRQDKFDFVVWRDAGTPGPEVARLNPKHVLSSSGVVSMGQLQKQISAGRRSSRQRSRRRQRRGKDSKSSASATTAAAMNNDVSKLKLPKAAKGGTCFQCYRGRARTPLITDLQPSTLYRFRVQIFKNNVSSLPSADIAVMTVPQKVRSGPVLLDTGTRWVRLRWTAAFTGAFAFRIQCWNNQAVGPSGQGARWETVWQGMDTTTEVTGLAASTTYRFRVVALNVAGGESEPSDILEVTTLSIPEGIRNRLTIRKANERFCIPCSGDIVVGDTILFRESIPRREIEMLGRKSCEKLGGAFLRRARLLLSPRYSCGWVRTLAARVVGESTTKRSSYQFKHHAKKKALKLLENRKGRSSKRNKNKSTALAVRSNNGPGRSKPNASSGDVSTAADGSTVVEDITAEEAAGQQGGSPAATTTNPGVSTTVVGALLSTKATKIQSKELRAKTKKAKKFVKERVLHMQVVLCELSSEDRLDVDSLRAEGDPFRLLYLEQDRRHPGSDEKTDFSSKDKVCIDYDKLWSLQYELASAHNLQEGSRILRTEGDAIYQFEVFRTRWEQEQLRVPYRVDWKAQQEWDMEQVENRKAIKDSAQTQAKELKLAAQREKRSLADERRRRHRIEENEPRLRTVVGELAEPAKALPQLPADKYQPLIMELRRLIGSLQEDQSQEEQLLQEATDMLEGFDAAATAAAEDEYDAYSDENEGGQQDDGYGDDAFNDSYGSTPRHRQQNGAAEADDDGYDEYDDDILAAVEGAPTPKKSAKAQRVPKPAAAAESSDDDDYGVVDNDDDDDAVEELDDEDDEDLVEEVVDDDLVVDEADDVEDDIGDEVESVE